MMPTAMAKTRSFTYRSQLPVPAAEVFDWHAREGALERLSPPWEPLTVIERTGGLEVGARTVVELPVGPLRRRWVAEHTAHQPGRMFQDTQREGPFRSFVHTHRMIPVGPGQSTLEDAISYELPMGAVGAFFGEAMVTRRLQRGFTYRHAVTRMDIERHARARARHSEPLHVAVTGASGLIGSALVPYLTTGGHRVTRLVRATPSEEGRVRWDPERGELNPDALEGVDAVVHLASASVSDGRWSDAQKKQILDSRVRGTRLIAETLAKMKRPPRVLICASGMNYYGHRGEELLDEASSKGRGFLSDVVEQWEAAAEPARQRGIRVVSLRISMVLTPKGGALQKLLTPFKAGVGGPVGSGTQWMSWISIEDLLGLVEHALVTDSLRGPVNAAAPGAVRNAEWGRTLGKVLRRPSVMPLPAPVVRAAFGQMGEELLLSSVRLEPKAALASGFQFELPELEPALRFLLGRQLESAPAAD